MTKLQHSVYILTMSVIVIAVTIYLSYIGYSYYILPIEERFYHPRYDWFKPSGLYGQGLGVVGTLLILFGVSLYIARKRYGFLSRFIRIKYLLEFHIFLCVLGPIMILFHTSFKFGGIVSVAFWSMVAVVLSGVIGRFIYIQIPRTIEGRELSRQELQAEKLVLSNKIQSVGTKAKEIAIAIEKFEEAKYYGFSGKIKMSRDLHQLKRQMSGKVEKGEAIELVKNLKEEKVMQGKIERLQLMQKLFKYWHVAHMPFALIMLVIVVIHVIVVVSLGYKWIF